MTLRVSEVGINEIRKCQLSHVFVMFVEHFWIEKIGVFFYTTRDDLKQKNVKTFNF